MTTAARWRAGSASDPGLQRSINEDRVWLDEARGIFLVVDGLGGHAAGEIAAAIAVDEISRILQTPADIKAAISGANNEIFRRAEEDETLRGMACVLTLAVIQQDQVYVGHVGDSRLYVFWNSRLQKITCDHSPVGEQEDRGLLTEEQAMRHPRRNEVFRDVGSVLHQADDDQFIETRAFEFKDDAALLLCSDGLTDCITAAEISQVIERYDGNAGRCAQHLVEAANAAGGNDNISVVFIAGADFQGSDSRQGQAARARHAATRPRGEFGGSSWTRYLWLLPAVILFAFGIWRFTRGVPGATINAPIVATHVFEVNSSDARGIIDALTTASAGDTIYVPTGEFLGPLVLKEGVNIVAKSPRFAIVRPDPAAVSEQGIGIVARGVHKAFVNGLSIAADDTHPLKTGVLLVDSSVELADLDISGAVYSGVRIEGDSKPELKDNFIHANVGAGIVVRDTAAPKLLNNKVIQNGPDLPARTPIRQEDK